VADRDFRVSDVSDRTSPASSGKDGCDNHPLTFHKDGDDYFFDSHDDGRDAWMNLDGKNVRLTLLRSVLVYTDEFGTANATYEYRDKQNDDHRSNFLSTATIPTRFRRRSDCDAMDRCVLTRLSSQHSAMHYENSQTCCCLFILVIVVASSVWAQPSYEWKDGLDRKASTHSQVTTLDLIKKIFPDAHVKAKNVGQAETSSSPSLRHLYGKGWMKTFSAEPLIYTSSTNARRSMGKIESFGF
jgi:hypothetical protein